MNDSFVISSEKLSVVISPVGAELLSVKSGEREYLWQADKKIWGRHAPILFPAVGRMYKNEYIYNGKTYPMNKHGFLRDKVFSVDSIGEDSAVLSFRSDESTKSVFPFDFIFTVSFCIKGGSLTETYSVKNTGAEAMYFSLGAHPGFFCRFGDILRFEKEETMKVPYLNGDDTPEDENAFITLDGTRDIVITPELFEKGSLALEAPESAFAQLCAPDGTPYLCERFGKVPMLWLWAKAGEEYICIEPWHGSDERKPEIKLDEKKGIVKLGAGEKFEFRIAIEV